MHSVLERSEIADILEKVESQERLTFEDGVRLFQTKDLAALGYAANIVRERFNGKKAYYVINHHINYSNICWDTCRFCAFARKPGQAGAYEFTLDDIFEKVQKLQGTRISELHIVGGLHPSLKWDYYVDMLRGIKKILPEVSIKMLTAVEIDWLARITRKSIETVIAELIEAGMDSIPGGGAEIFAPDVRKEICPNKISAERWMEIHEAAHKQGLRTGVTMLYGHIESIEDRVDHILRAREQQDRSGGFINFIPLSFHPDNTEYAHIPQASGVTDLKCLAVSRLLLDNIPHIKSYWVSSTLPLAQIALSYGADDLDGTIEEERIYHMAGAKTPQLTAEERLIAAIQETGYVPVRRDTYYQALETFEAK